jgi:hypothetical protein
LKLGNLGFCLGAEKKEESDFDSFTVAANVTAVVVDNFPSFLTITEGRDDDATDTALFFAGGPTLDGMSGSLRFFCFASTQSIKRKFDGPALNPVMTRPTLYIVVSRYDLVLHKNKLISPLSFKIRRHVLDRCKMYIL